MDLHYIATSSYECFDLQVLFEGFEEQFDLSSVLIDGSNGCGSQGQVVGEKKQDFFLLLVIDLDATKSTVR